MTNQFTKNSVMCTVMLIGLIWTVSCSKNNSREEPKNQGDEIIQAPKVDKPETRNAVCSVVLNYRIPFKGPGEESDYGYILYSVANGDAQVTVSPLHRGTLIQTEDNHYAVLDSAQFQYERERRGSILGRSWSLCETVARYSLMSDFELLAYREPYFEQAVRHAYTDIPKDVMPYPKTPGIVMNPFCNRAKCMGTTDALEISLDSHVLYTAPNQVIFDNMLSFVHTMYASDESYIPEKYLMEYDPDECYGCEDEDDSDEENEECECDENEAALRKKVSEFLERYCIGGSYAFRNRTFQVRHTADTVEITETVHVGDNGIFEQIRPEIDKAIQNYKELYVKKAFQKEYPGWNVTVIPLYALKDDNDPSKGLTAGVTIDITPKYAHHDNTVRRYRTSIPYDRLPNSVRNAVDANRSAPDGCGIVDWDNQALVLNGIRYSVDLHNVIGVNWYQGQTPLSDACLSVPHIPDYGKETRKLSAHYQLVENSGGGRTRMVLHELGVPLFDYDPLAFEYSKLISGRFILVRNKLSNLYGLRHVRTNEWVLPATARNLTHVPQGTMQDVFVLIMDHAGVQLFKKHAPEYRITGNVQQDSRLYVLNMYSKEVVACATDCILELLAENKRME